MTKAEKRQAQLDRIETKVCSVEVSVQHIEGRVLTLERKSFTWGALASVLVSILSHVAGCV